MRFFSLLVILALTANMVFALNASGNASMNASVNTSINISPNASMDGNDSLPPSNVTINPPIEDDLNLTIPSDDYLEGIIDRDVPRGFGVFILRLRGFFARHPVARLHVELRLALSDLKRADAAVKSGRKEAAEKALERYAERVKRIREALDHLSQPPEDILEKLAVYAEYEQHIRARLAELGVEDDTPSLEDIIREKGYDEANLTLIRERALRKYGVSRHVLVRNEERFIAKVEAAYLVALKLNLSFNASAVRMHLELAKQELRMARELMNTSNATGFKQHLRAAHEHAVQALRLLPKRKHLPKEDVILPLNGTLIIKHDDKIRILPLPKPEVEERVLQAFRKKGVRVVPPEEVRELVRKHARAYRQEQEDREHFKRLREHAREERRELRPPFRRLPPLPGKRLVDEEQPRSGKHELGEVEPRLTETHSGSMTGGMEHEGSDESADVQVSVNGSSMFP